MNQKLKFKLIALVAALSGTGWNSSQAQLEQANVAGFTQPAVQSPRPVAGNTFGTVQSAIPFSSRSGDQLPPIVAPTQVGQANLPPIVSRDQYKTAADSVPESSIEIPAALPPIVSLNPSRTKMLLPLPQAESPKVSRSASLANVLPNNANRPPQTTNMPRSTMAIEEWKRDNAVAPAAQWQQAPSRNGAYLNTGFSAAGVPLYAGSSPQDTGIQASPSDSVLETPVISSESQIISPIAPPLSAPRNFDQPYAADISSMPAQTPTYFDSPTMEVPYAGDYQDGAAFGGSGFATSDGNSGGFDQNAIDSRMGYFGAMSRARRYNELDVLYMTRTDGDIVLSNFGGLGSFDANLGWRATLGLRTDDTNGREISYFGTTELDKEINRTDALGRLSALFTPSSFFSAGEAAPFFNAVIQNERMQTQLHSVEFNKVQWGWDVVKSFIGLRYIYVNDEYEMFSQREFAAVPPSFSNPAGTPARTETGNYRLNAQNNLVGVHIGRELFYDVGYRLSFSGLGKAGIYANVNKFESSASNSGTTFQSNENNNSTLATSLDLHLTGHYQLSRRARFRVGYQALLLDNVASVSDNLSGSLSPFLGANTGDSDSMFFHGINLGLEFYR